MAGILKVPSYHVMDFLSISDPEVFTVGNIAATGSRIRLYDSNNPSNGYLISTSNSKFGIWKESGTTLLGI